MRIVFLSWFLIVVMIFACAQQRSKEDKPQWLFPDDQVLLRSADVGFSSTTELPLETIYERKGVTLEEGRTGCPERMDEVQAAGPLWLAAMLGRKARIQSTGAPNRDTVLESRGALLLSVKFYARKKDTQTDIELWQDDHKYQPASKHVNREDNLGCKFSSAPLLENSPGDFRYRVEQAFVFRFAPTVNADWDRSFRLVLRRTDGRVEEYAVSFADSFTRQARKIR